MSILQLSPVKVGQSGVKPSSYKMVSSDSLSTITTAGFLKQGTGGQFLERNDVIEVIASFGSPSVENADLYVTIDTNGVITLNVDLPEGLGNAALKNVTDNTKPLVSSVSGATTVGNIAVFSDITGTIEDGGALDQAAFKSVSNNALPSVASVDGATVVGNLLQSSDVTGSVDDSGIQATNVQLKTDIIASQATVGGAGVGPYNIAVVGAVIGSIVVATIQTSAVTASVVRAVAGPGLIQVEFSADPGAGSEVNYIVFLTPQ